MLYGTDKARMVLERLERLGIAAMQDEEGKIVLSAFSRETESNVTLFPDEMEELLDKAGDIGLQCLDAKARENILVTLFNMGLQKDGHVVL